MKIDAVGTIHYVQGVWVDWPVRRSWNLTLSKQSRITIHFEEAKNKQSLAYKISPEPAHTIVGRYHLGVPAGACFWLRERVWVCVGKG